jgi:hypothetical protein
MPFFYIKTNRRLSIRHQLGTIIVKHKHYQHELDGHTCFDVVCMDKMTCTYFDKSGTKMLVEEIPH